MSNAELIENLVDLGTDFSAAREAVDLIAELERRNAALGEEVDFQKAARETAESKLDELTKHHSEFVETAHASHREMEASNAALLAEVREWMCEQCNTVYPGPPQQGFACVLCPRCGGNTAPRLTVEKTKLESRLHNAIEAIGLMRTEVEQQSGLRNEYQEWGQFFTIADGQLLKASAVERQSTNVTAHMHKFGPEDEHKISRCECGVMMVPINYG